jgi:pantoate--beta-alanine ligase
LKVHGLLTKSVVFLVSVNHLVVSVGSPMPVCRHGVTHAHTHHVIFFISGHLSLVREARANNDVLVASIFVNPTQFGPGEDLDRYPRQLERDTQLLTELGVDHLFAPSTMYGQHHVTYIVPEGFDSIPEGRVRPGHFRGVATIVAKLFNIVQPTNAYFGQKDAAQCVLIQRMVQDLDMDVNVVIKETIREADGLAMSSRNAYLTADERRAAPIVYQSLCAARRLFHDFCSTTATTTTPPDGTSNMATVLSSEALRECVEKALSSEPLVREIQYISVDSRATMQPLTAEGVHRETGCIISLACKVGSVRLIDNIVLAAVD